MTLERVLDVYRGLNGGVIKPARLVLQDVPGEYADRLEVRKDGGITRRGRGANQIYNHGCMKPADLKLMGGPTRLVSTDDAYNFDWTCRPNIPMILDVIAGRGLKPITWPFTWKKLHPNGEDYNGAGRYVWNAAEDVLESEPLEDDDGPGEVLLSRNAKARTWHSNTHWRPDMFIELAHPRYPKTSDDPRWELDCPAIDDELGLIYYGPGKLVQCGMQLTGDDGRKHTVICHNCRTCLKGKIINSRKPEELQDRLDKWLDDDLDGHCKIELFATRQRELRGSKYPWICLGYDVTGRDVFTDLQILAYHMEVA